MDDVFGDDNDDARAMTQIGERLSNIGFEQGVAETYSTDSKAYQEAFQQGAAEGFRQALQAAQLLGKSRLLKYPSPAAIKQLYVNVANADYDQAPKTIEELLLSPQTPQKTNERDSKS